MKRILLTLTGVLVCAALFVFVYHNYQKHPNTTAATVSQAQYQDVKKQLDSAQATMAEHDRVNEHNLALKQETLQKTVDQRNALCNQYKNVKPAPTPALCQ